MQCQNVPQWIPLRTRTLSCVFETDTGYLRPVKITGVEVLRAIYGAVRDRNWDTVLPVTELAFAFSIRSRNAQESHVESHTRTEIGKALNFLSTSRRINRSKTCVRS